MQLRSGQTSKLGSKGSTPTGSRSLQNATRAEQDACVSAVVRALAPSKGPSLAAHQCEPPSPEQLEKTFQSMELMHTAQAHGFPADFFSIPADDIVNVPYKGKQIKARLLHIIDGDTVCVAIHCGHPLKLSVRLIGIDTPELHPKHVDEVGEAIAAEKVKQYVIKLFQNRELIDIKLLKNDKWGGRYVGHVYLDSGECLSQHLIEKGYGKKYDGRAKSPWVASDFAAINKSLR